MLNKLCLIEKVPLGDVLKQVKDLYESILRVPVNALVNARAYYDRNVSKVICLCNILRNSGRARSIS